jgi:WD40 repeat protein
VVLTLRGHTHEIAGLACSSDGRRLASPSGDKTTKIWDATPLDATSAQETLTLRGHTEQILDLAFSPNGRGLASASRDATVRVWDANTGREELQFKKHVRVVFGVAFSHDGQRVASESAHLAEGDPSCVMVWDATTGQEVLPGSHCLYAGRRSLARSLRSLAIKVADQNPPQGDIPTTDAGPKKF